MASFTYSSSSTSSSPASSFLHSIARHLCAAALLTLLLPVAPRLSHATPALNRRQTVTDGGACAIEGPDMIDFDKSEGPKTFILTKTGSCVVDYVDIYQIVSYEPKDYQLFSYRLLEDGVSVTVMIHLAWPRPSASASDRNQYLVYKGYASIQDKEDNKPPVVQHFVKINIVERQPDTNVENYRDPLSSDLMTPPIYFLDEESAMANASCVTKGFQFSVKASAKLVGVNPKLSMEVSVYQQTEDGKWEDERSWSDGGDSGDDWSVIHGDVGTSITTVRSETMSEMTVDVVQPLVDSYFVFNVLVKDELNWYRTGSAHFIAKWVQAECDGTKSEFDNIWSDIDENTPPTTTTPATTILPNVILEIIETTVEPEKDDDDDDDDNESEKINSIPEDEGIDKEAKNAAVTSSSISLLSVTTTLLSCALCLPWSR